MSKQLVIAFVTAVAVALLLPATPAAAESRSPDDGTTIFNEDYTLAAGDSITGDLVVINGDLTMEGGSRVEGSVFVWSGDAEIEGTVERDVVVTQGDLHLGAEALVEGDVVCSWSCELDREGGAQVEGNVVEGAPLPLPWITSEGERGPRVPALSGLWDTGVRPWLNWVFGVVRVFATVVVLAIVAGVAAAILPRQTAEVGRTVLAAPGQSVGIGILTVIAAVLLIVGLAVTICFSPVAIAVALGLGAASLFGWICIGALVGERLLKAAKSRDHAPMWAAALGTLLLSLLTMFVGAVGVACLDVIASVISAIVGFIGLGAVVLTRFGTRPYDPRPQPAHVAPEVLLDADEGIQAASDELSEEDTSARVDPAADDADGAARPGGDVPGRISHEGSDEEASGSA